MKAQDTANLQNAVNNLQPGQSLNGSSFFGNLY
jgi:hypothetical protein